MFRRTKSSIDSGAYNFTLDNVIESFHEVDAGAPSGHIGPDERHRLLGFHREGHVVKGLDVQVARILERHLVERQEPSDIILVGTANDRSYLSFQDIRFPFTFACLSSSCTLLAALRALFLRSANLLNSVLLRAASSDGN